MVTTSSVDPADALLADRQVTEPIPWRGGKVGPVAKFGSFVPFTYDNGDVVVVEANSVAVSTNGEWLAVKTRGSRNTLTRIDVTSRAVLPFSAAVQCCQGFSDQTPLAIDPSGEFVAQGRIDWGSDPLAVWDIAPCMAPPADGTSLATNCAVRSITVLAGDPTFTPSRTVSLTWTGGVLNFVARFPSGISQWTLVPNAPPGVDHLSIEGTPNPSTVGTHVTLLATLLTAQSQAPRPDVLVRFEVTNGPDAGFAALVRTDSSGTAAALLLGRAVGTDLVQAWVDTNTNGVIDDNEPNAQTEVSWSPSTLRLVALGDSFSSGEGTFAYDGDGQSCHRGDGAWPRQLTARAPAISSLVHLACTGARTSHLLNRWTKKGQPRQMPKLSDSSVNLVTVTIGGNDVGFVGIVRKCFTGNCSRVPTSTGFTNKLSTLRSRLESKIYPALEAAYPNARIVHVGYPRMTPPPGSPATGCGWLTPSEQNAADEVMESINETIASAASATAGRVEFASATDSLLGHELCTAASWANPVLGLPAVYGTEQAHPTYDGQTAYARTVAADLGLALIDD
jgi:lysophospholipase L1-like esterase